MKIKDITSYLEDFAPLYYQEDYDNCGLIVGNENIVVEGALITLDCTEDIIDEAIEEGCNLVIAHHPIIFSAIKKLNGSNYIERVIIKAIKHDIAIYAMHTNLDNIKDGVNAKIADRLGLQNTFVLSPKKDVLRQLTFYCPTKYVEKVRNALFVVGAGSIGSYDQCSFSFSGRGTFRPSQKSNPFVGEIGKMHIEEEECVEVIFPTYLESDIILKLQETHPYEKIAYQIYFLDNMHQDIGSGLVGDLPHEVHADDFLKQLKAKMKVNCIRYTSIVRDTIKKVAVCGGSGSFLLSNAKSSGADIYISADFKYHEFFDAAGDIIVADIGHYESEQFTKELIYDLLTKKFTKFAIRLSKVNTNPIKYL